MDVLAAMEAAKSVSPGLIFETYHDRQASTYVRVVDGVEGFPAQAPAAWLAWVNSRFIGARIKPGESMDEEARQELTAATMLKSGDTVLLKLSTEPQS